MIEINGQALALEPGKVYLLVYDDTTYTREAIESLCRRMYDVEGIHIYAVPVPDPKAVRIVQVEQPEHPFQSEERT